MRIKRGLTDLKKETENISEEEKEIEKPNKIIDIVKNEIRQLLYSLYRSKKLTKTIYNHLINTLKMERIFMNTENSITIKPHRFRLSLVDKLNLKDSNKNMAPANLSIYYTWKNIKPAYSKSKFKISAPTCNDEFDLPDRSYSIANIHYFEFITKKHELKTGYKLELLSPETMKFLGSTEKYVDQDKDVENVQKLESVGFVLVHCTLFNNNYQQATKVLFTFVINK